MENSDVFESVFKRAVRQPYEYRQTPLKTILLVTDLEPDDTAAYENKVKRFLRGLLPSEKSQWITLHKHNYIGWVHLRAHIERRSPSLIVTYRLLQEAHKSRKFSLGSFLDTMTQYAQVPVLVLPDPESKASSRALENRSSVLVVTNHLNGEHALVNFGALFTVNGGKLTLCHLEDQDIFNYYLAAIEKIPEISTDVARERIQGQLLAQSRQYAESVTQVLRAKRPKVQVQTVIEIGHIIDRFREIIRTRKANLLVLASKDETQLAMHSIGYSLAVEFKKIPMLLV